jgi:F-type H+-transporting ATPase subunit gamma
MKMVAASKLRRAQDAILRLRPYAAKLSEIITNVSHTGVTTDENPYAARQGDPKRVLLVAITSNKGLCGTFNTNVFKSVQGLMQGSLAPYADSGNLDIICIGKKVHEYLVRRKIPVVAEYNDLFTNPDFERVSEVSSMILEEYRNGRWDRIIIVYNQFKNAAMQVVNEEEYLPLAGNASNDEPVSEVEYLYEPDRTQILTELIPKALKIQFYKTILNSYASEHGARMTAMHKATENAGEMLKELRLVYNKARQASITREIIEIVSGAEALKG